VQEARQNGCGTIDLANDYKKGYLKIIDPGNNPGEEFSGGKVSAETTASSNASSKKRKTSDTKVDNSSATKVDKEPSTNTTESSSKKAEEPLIDEAPPSAPATAKKSCIDEPKNEKTNDTDEPKAEEVRTCPETGQATATANSEQTADQPEGAESSATTAKADKQSEEEVSGGKGESARCAVPAKDETITPAQKMEASNDQELKDQTLLSDLASSSQNAKVPKSKRAPMKLRRTPLRTSSVSAGNGSRKRKADSVPADSGVDKASATNADSGAPTHAEGSMKADATRKTSASASGQRVNASTKEEPYATDSKGLFIRTRMSGSASSRYLGVSIHKESGMWQAVISNKSNKKQRLGLFKNEEAAAVAYKEALLSPDDPKPKKAKKVQPPPITVPKTKPKQVAEAKPVGVVAPPPATLSTAGSGSTGTSSQAQTGVDKTPVDELQRRIDELDDQQYQRILKFMQSDVKPDGTDGQPSLYLKSLSEQKLRDLERLLAAERPSKGQGLAERPRIVGVRPSGVPASVPTQGNSTPRPTARPSAAPSIAPRILGSATPSARIPGSATPSARPSQAAQVSGARPLMLRTMSRPAPSPHAIMPSQQPMSSPPGSSNCMLPSASAASLAPSHVNPQMSAVAAGLQPVETHAATGSWTPVQGASACAGMPVTAASWTSVSQHPGTGLAPQSTAPSRFFDPGLSRRTPHMGFGTENLMERSASLHPVAPDAPPMAEGWGCSGALGVAGGGRVGNSESSWHPGGWAAEGTVMMPQQWNWMQDAATMPVLAASTSESSILPEASWLGDGGGWDPGGEPNELFQLPKVSLGDTYPPGPCREGCRCGQVASRISDLEKPWLADKARSSLVTSAMLTFERQPGVIRRGRVSRQNRFQPAPGGWPEMQLAGPLPPANVPVNLEDSTPPLV